MTTKRKRSNGEGSIYWNESRGRFEGMLDLGPGADGKRRRRKVTGPSRADVAERLSVMRQQAAQGLPVAAGDLTVAALLDRWITDVLPTKVESGTVDSYRWAAEHIRPALGARRVTKLTPEDVEGFLKAKSATLGRSSLVRIRAVLGQALRWAEKRGYVARNVASLADMPASTKASKEGRALTADEARALLVAIAGHRLEALWLTQVTLGLRPGEVAGLRWRDVDVETGVVHVRSSLRWTDARPSLVEPKTARSRRSLRAPAPVIRALRAHRIRQAEFRLALGRSWPAEWSDLVFTTEAGTPIDPANARRELTKVTKAAELGHLRPYDLRHSAASLLAAAGVPLEHIADLLGHDGLRMARLVYVHALSPTVEVAATPMERLLGS
ncbi:site-specific integrase [soil metagenome]